MANMYFTRDFDSRLPRYGLEKRAGMTLGFGPFWGISKLLPRSVRVLHRMLQALPTRASHRLAQQDRSTSRS